MSINSVILEKLLEQITIARERMQLLWEKKEYTDHEVLAASIEVDHLLNEYDRVLLIMQERKSDHSGGKR